MEVPELVINLAGEEFTLSEFSTWVCLFTDVPAYCHRLETFNKKQGIYTH